MSNNSYAKTNLTPEELKKCHEFSKECAKSQQDIEFGESTTIARQMDEIARDILIGKIAEIAFQKLMKQRFNREIELDFKYYPRGVWDNQDVEINGWKIDIKAVRSGGNWFLIEWNKLNFRAKESKLPHLFVAFLIGWNRNNDQPTGDAEFKGFVRLDQLNPETNFVEILRKDEFIPNTRTQLQTDNYGIRFCNLQWSLKSLNYLLQKKPDDQITQTFKSPEELFQKGGHSL